MYSELSKWELVFKRYLSKVEFKDASHGLSHFERVWKIAKNISTEDADLLTVMAGCYFHDIVNYPKNHPDRSLSSTHAAEKTKEILNDLEFPQDKIENACHCVKAHSFSANIYPETIEAKIVQDADRMESLGAIGLARTFYVAGMLGSQLFCEDDPFAKNRELNDNLYAVDHFKVKLLKLSESMQTEKGKKEAEKRTQVLLKFLDNLSNEL